MKQDTDLFKRLRTTVGDIPVIDCHEHMMGPAGMPPYKEPIAALTPGYVQSDLQSAAFGVSNRDFAALQDPDVSTDTKWPVFEKLWNATEHTAYARVTKIVLRDVYGITKLDRPALDVVASKLTDQNPDTYMSKLEDANIKALLVDVLGWVTGGLDKYIDGTETYPDMWRPLISLPGFHPNVFTRETVETFANILDRTVTSLDGYLEVVF